MSEQILEDNLFIPGLEAPRAADQLSFEGLEALAGVAIEAAEISIS